MAATRSNRRQDIKTSRSRRRARGRLHVEGLEERALLTIPAGGASFLDGADDFALAADRAALDPGIGGTDDGDANPFDFAVSPTATQFAPILVTSLADSGPGTLRQAISDANSIAGDDEITFAAGLAGTIQLSSTLPELNTNLTIRGPGADRLTIRGMGPTAPGSFRIISARGATVRLEGLTITGGGYGSSSTVPNYEGGGIRNEAGNLSIINSLVTDNRAAFGGAGGGIYNYQGVLTITNSTISNNRTLGNDSTGGGIASLGTLNLINSTVSGNGADIGGGISGSGTINVQSSTITGNSSYLSSGGIDSHAANFIIRNSVVAGNSASSAYPKDIYSLRAVASQGNNLIGSTNGSSGWIASDLTGTDPRLGPLQNNGGPTPTHALLPGSPAIDAGNNANPPDTDQRGLARIVDGNADGSPIIDIGAVEMATIPVPPSVTLSVAPGAISEAGGQSTVTATLSAATSQAVTVNLGFTGTASHPADYARSGASMTIPAGQTTGSITLSVAQDALYEGDESIVVTITTVQGGSASGSPVSVTITDDDPPASGDLFRDDFASGALGASWTTAGGEWSQAGGALRQSGTGPGDPKKALAVGVATPAAAEVAARVRVDSWAGGDMARAGVSLGNDAAGRGYNLVFHADTGTVQFLHDGVAWGSHYGFAWQVGSWYWFELRQEADGTLYGKVWADGSAEPSGWMFEQRGWAARPGSAGLNGGSDGGATASFDDFAITANSSSS